jgi:hypothetical protein
MSPKIRRLYTCLFLTGIFAIQHSAEAQNDPAKYKERAASIRADVWGWKVPAFNNRTVPAEYSNESSVILARRAVIEADTKKKMNWAMLAAVRDFYYNSTVRELVKINDKASLEEYSELNYRQFKKLNGWVSATATTFVGARIIKPNGSVKEVNLDESVLMKSDKNEQQRKLAISDLQVGDLLDFYIRVEEFSAMIKEPERLIFLFGEDHPILDYSIHCEIGNKYAVEYRSMNKAPEAKQSTNDDKDLILDIAMNHISALPTSLWMSSLRETPAFRINVLAGGKELSGRAKGEVINGVPLKDVLSKKNLEAHPFNPLLQQKLQKEVVEILRNYDKHYRKLPQDSIAYLIYYAYRFATYYNEVDKDLEVGEDRNGMELSTSPYLGFLGAILSDHKIPYNTVYVPSRYGPDINQVMGPGDMVCMIRLNLDKPVYISNMNMFTCAGYIPAYLEGQPCPEFTVANLRHNEAIDISQSTPLSQAADNLHKEDIKLTLEGTDMQLIHVKRNTVLTGKMKEGEQPRLLNFEDCYESERAALRVEKSIMDELKKARKSKNVSEDYATALQKARASLKDRFKAEIESEFQAGVKDMIAWKVNNPGSRHTAPDLAYSTEFTEEGLVQRAGNNFLLNIGKTFNSPPALTPSQRIRTVDVYMSHARTIDCTVAFTVPSGYSVQGVDKLNKTLENECGSVISSAQVQGDQLIVHFKRIYKHNMETAGKWTQLLAIIDASNDFAGTKVLLKKG